MASFNSDKIMEKIVKTAADLYDKVAGFEDTFMGVGDLITRLSGTFDKEAWDEAYEKFLKIKG